tara:strand:+ start:54 stop:557 length:504 start_codon:yes stop_codon:yes gene_type:complete
MGNKKAFTLIELLVVVAIIGILAAVGVVAYNGYTESAKSSTVKSTCQSVEKFIRLETTKCNTGLTEYIFDQKNTNNFLCPLNVVSPGRTAKNAFINYVGYSRCSFCTMKNPFKQTASLMQFNNWGRINDNHLGYIFVSDNNTGIDIYCCYSTPCKDSANHTRLNIIP